MNFLSNLLKKVGLNPTVTAYGAGTGAGLAALEDPTDIQNIALSSLLGGSLGSVPKSGHAITYGTGGLLGLMSTDKHAPTTERLSNVIQGAALSNLLSKGLFALPKKSQKGIVDFLNTPASAMEKVLNYAKI